MQNCAANLDPDHARVGRRGSCISIRQWLDHQRHEGRSHIDRHHLFPFARLTAPPRKVPGNQSILLPNIADPRARLKTLCHNPCLEIIRPLTPPGPPIKYLDPRHSPRPTHLHSVLILVLHRRPPVNSVAGRHARHSIRPKPRGSRTAYYRSLHRPSLLRGWF